MKYIAAIIIVLILLVGCGNEQSTVLPTYAVTSITPTETHTSEPTRSPTETPRIAPRREGTDAANNSPQDAYPPEGLINFVTPLASDYPAPPPVVDTHTPAPTPTPITPLEVAQQAWNDCKNSEIPADIKGFEDQRLTGLVFRYWNWLWQIDEDGRPTVISCLALSSISPNGRWMTFWLNKTVWAVDRETNVVRSISSSPERYSALGSWSPDARFFYYLEAVNEAEPTDIWVWDSITGQSRQVTNSPEVREYSVQVWLAYPNWLVFRSWPPELLNEPEVEGYLTIIRTDGIGEQRVSELQGTRYAFSPDRKKIAYRDREGAWLFQPGNAPEAFLPESFAIEGWNINNLSRPGWSPDGTKIAWWASGEDETGKYSGVAVFDLEQKKAWFVHPFVHMGMGGSPSFFEWDPSSTWLSMYVRDQDVSREGFWVVRFDGSEEHQSSLHTNVIIWDPVGDRFLYKDASATKIYLKQVGSWTSVETDLPYETIPMSWEEMKSP